MKRPNYVINRERFLAKFPIGSAIRSNKTNASYRVCKPEDPRTCKLMTRGLPVSWVYLPWFNALEIAEPA